MYNDLFYMVVWCGLAWGLIVLAIDVAWLVDQITRKEEKDHDPDEGEQADKNQV